MTGGGPDFLSRIAAKTVGAAPLLEPRPPSRFEARREGADEAPPSWEDSAEAAVGAEPAGSPSPRRALVEAVANDIRPVTIESEDEAQPARPRKAETAPRRAAAAQPPPPARASPARMAQPAPASARDEAPLAVPDLPRPLLVPPAETRATDPLESAIASRPAFEPVVPAMREQDRGSPPAPRAAASDVAVRGASEAPAPASHPIGRARDLAVRMPEIRPRPMRGEIRAAERSPPPPVVNITIGRIEVRADAATAAPPARPAQSPRTPPQSLADYLKRRGGAR
ncbi:MAG TPA: hypothetical protein VGO55_17330 [Allosphingosinicella sp.]|jgi:hypothetical protein|nr:hypothetical protein [Allosphingosinicella sp.]